jgi:histidyl-tRNA synthetase
MERELIISRGGRYDACASRIAEKPVSACGFAFMMEPIVTLLGYRQFALHGNAAPFKDQLTIVIGGKQRRIVLPGNTGLGQGVLKSLESMTGVNGNKIRQAGLICWVTRPRWRLSAGRCAITTSPSRVC